MIAIMIRRMTTMIIRVVIDVDFNDNDDDDNDDDSGGGGEWQILTISV